MAWFGGRGRMSDTHPPRLGIVGAGQLARMTYQAAISLGLTVRLLAQRQDESAARIGADVTLGSAKSAADLTQFAAACDVVTFDHELVAVAALSALERAGRPLRPSAAVVAVAQNKQRQRERLAAMGAPIPAFQPVATIGEVQAFAAAHGWPVVLKAAQGGYDGRGVWTAADAAAAEAVLTQTARRGLA